MDNINLDEILAYYEDQQLWFYNEDAWNRACFSAEIDLRTSKELYRAITALCLKVSELVEHAEARYGVPKQWS
jgi:hypothetical protein